MDKIKIALAEDHLLILQGIKLIINGIGDFKIIIEATNGKELLQKVESANIKPDLALIDIGMPEMDGFETMKQLTLKFPEIKGIGLSVFSDFNSVFRMINNGAKAYLLKDSTTEQVKNTLLTVFNEGSYYSSFVVEKLVDYNNYGKNSQNTGLASITEREKEFIINCCSELAYKEIAAKMKISPRTVDGFRESLFDKLGIKSRTGIVLFAIKNKLFLPEY